MLFFSIDIGYKVHDSMGRNTKQRFFSRFILVFGVKKWVFMGLLYKPQAYSILEL